MATPGFRNGVLAIFVIFGVLAVGGGFLAGRLLQGAVERTSSPSASVAPVTTPSGTERSPSRQSVEPTSEVTPNETAPPSAGTPITPAGAQLRSAAGDVYAMDPAKGCKAFIRTGYSGTCGIADMRGSQTAWVVETRPVDGWASAAQSLRILTFSNELNGWVEQLRARDPHARKWTGIRVVTRDLTGDGKPELVVGYRYLGSGGDLGIDIVENTDGVPIVAAHPNDAIHGAVVFRGSTIEQYMAQYPNHEANCCPPYFLKRTIRFLDGAYRVTATAQVSPSEVPASQL